MLFAAVVLVSCGKPLPELKGFDRQAWKEDKGGCNGSRQALKTALESEKQKLLSLSEDALVELLGKPDQTELYKRSEKFYKYFLSGGKNCPQQNATIMVVRFNAIGLAKEVVME